RITDKVKHLRCRPWVPKGHRPQCVTRIVERFDKVAIGRLNDRSKWTVNALLPERHKRLKNYLLLGCIHKHLHRQSREGVSDRSPLREAGPGGAKRRRDLSYLRQTNRRAGAAASFVLRSPAVMLDGISQDEPCTVATGADVRHKHLALNGFTPRGSGDIS